MSSTVKISTLDHKVLKEYNIKLEKVINDR